MEESEVNTQARAVMTNRRHDMRYRLILITMILVSCVAPARAQLLPPIFPSPVTPQRFILRAPGGIGVVQTVCGLIGCGLLESLGDPDSQVFVISTSFPAPLNQLNTLLSFLGITNIEPDLLVSLLPATPLISGATGVPDGLRDTNLVQFYGSPVWNGYASQPAANAVRANEARDWYNVAGTGTIGIIDTGVDPNHPALYPILVPGYDFTRNQAGSGSEMADLNQSTVAVVDGAPPAVVNGSTMAVLNQSTVAVVDQSGFAAFGHGTMVAGIVHLVAPMSYIMPLKAFGPDGTGFTSDIIRAVYFAAPQVNALNMSFSMPQPSAELRNALDYAAAQSVVSVAAAGNDGTATVVYPAGFQNDVMGVGSTSLSGTRSTFSNYGSAVWVAAPGEGIISTYPFGSYSAGWGTSFSAPFVTGTLGLLKNLQPNLNEQSASSAIANADPIGGDMGHGELDVVQALSAIQSQP
jgi:subtilisin family serine protease